MLPSALTWTISAGLSRAEIPGVSQPCGYITGGCPVAEVYPLIDREFDAVYTPHYVLCNYVAYYAIVGR